MIDTKDEIIRLYKDALYIHLIRKGYSIRKAKNQLKQIFDN